ncbi:MAG TPA: Rieske 2Fe-2S domain-containing protein [Vicinamibacterales bacterium]|jgi:nitrite reductase/ring-hydroxylating ferredoxin subunit|nr:Rieske 2Fe-2S domain-containing protein [Vicinamibacterales bacterium]
MPDPHIDPRASVDARVNSPGREGLTGTAPANRYAPIADREEITMAPDFRPAEMQPAWRQDFPIDWPQDQYVERREFVKFMVLTSFGLTVGQFWIAAENWWRARRGLPQVQRIASLDELAVGSSLVFRYPGEHDPCVLTRLADRELVAYSQKCTHLSCAVIPDPERGALRCPCHDGLFDLRSGKPTAGPPRRPLPRILLEVRGRDVFATGVEWRTS